MLSEAWIAIYNELKSRKCDIEVLASHSIFSDIIPYNLTFFTEELLKNASGKVEKSDGKIKLTDYEVKDIIDENLELIDDNIKHNVEVRAKITKLLGSKHKLSKEIITVKNNLKILDILEKCKEIYHSEDESKTVSLAELSEIYRDMNI